LDSGEEKESYRTGGKVMYKCEEGHIFVFPKVLQEPHGEEHLGCPECQNNYEEVFKCRICGEWHEKYYINKTICHECAEKLYTDRLGLKFVDKHKREFYLGCLNGIDKVYEEKETDLIKIIEKDFLEHIDMDNDWNGNLKEVKDFCMEDIDLFIDFLEEEI
jgi:hypothetical protein